MPLASFVCFNATNLTVMMCSSAEQVDSLYNFHESSFLDFPEDDNHIRTFTYPTSEGDEEIFVCEEGYHEGLIEMVKQKIQQTESGLDDFDEDSEQFVTLSTELDTLVDILTSLEYL